MNMLHVKDFRTAMRILRDELGITRFFGKGENTFIFKQQLDDSYLRHCESEVERMEPLTKEALETLNSI